MRTDRTCLSHWFPRIEAAGVPVPRTRIIRLEDAWHLGAMMDGVRPKWPGLPAFLASIAIIGDEFGWPCFLRTGHGSGKHEWSRCCFLPDAESIEAHVANLVFWSEMVDFLGLPFDVWVVREMLPTRPVFRCRRYGGFPVVREFRVFVDGAKVLYVNPYWPAGALEVGDPDDQDWRSKLPLVQGGTPQEFAEVERLASLCGAACGGCWSVDVLDTDRGWFVTDMAEAERSYGWDPNRRDP